MKIMIYHQKMMFYYLIIIMISIILITFNNKMIKMNKNKTFKITKKNFVRFYIYLFI
jgi:hypothetical protein